MVLHARLAAQVVRKFLLVGEISQSDIEFPLKYL